MDERIAKEPSDGKTDHVQQHFSQTVRIQRERENPGQGNQTDDRETDAGIQNNHGGDCKLTFRRRQDKKLMGISFQKTSGGFVLKRAKVLPLLDEFRNWLLDGCLENFDLLESIY